MSVATACSATSSANAPHREKRAYKQRNEEYRKNALSKFLHFSYLQLMFCKPIRKPAKAEKRGARSLVYAVLTHTCVLSFHGTGARFSASNVQAHFTIG